MRDLAVVRELAAVADHFGVLATTRKDATVHASLVKAGVLDDPDTGEASVGIVVGGEARKLGHLRASGQATIVFAHGARWVAVDGPVHIVEADEGTEGVAPILRSVYTAAGGTHDDWDEFDRAMADEGRCAALVAVHRITTN